MDLHYSANIMNTVLVSKFRLHFGQTESVQKMVIFKSSINQVINYANMDIQHHFIEKGVLFTSVLM